MRRQVLFAAFVGLLVLTASCGTPEKSNTAQGPYRLKCGPMVPPEIARAIESKICHEGRNQIDSSPTSRLYAVITKGELDSIILEVDGEKPTVVARMPDPAPSPPIETPMGCDQRYNVCVEGCNSSPDPKCCKCRCLLEWVICRGSGPGGGSLGISMR